MTNERITRESLLRDDVGEWRRKYSRWVSVMSPEQFREQFDKALCTAPPSRAVWVFAYGSLLWNPAIKYAEQRVARLFGYHRAFCVQSLVGRGTPKRPGLMLGLRAGGSCVGLAYRLPTRGFKHELELLFRREIMTGGYRSLWRDLYTCDGPVRAMCFVVKPSSPRFVQALQEREEVAVLSRAAGPLGQNRDYLFQTVASLREHGIHDKRLERLARLVREHTDRTTIRR